MIIGGLLWFEFKHLKVNPESIRTWVLSFGWVAPVIYIGMYITCSKEDRGRLFSGERRSKAREAGVGDGEEGIHDGAHAQNSALRALRLG